MRTTSRAAVVAALLTPTALIGASSASATNKPDPCPGQHNQVYSENSNVKLPHFTCGGGVGPAGPQGPAGKDGSDGKDSTVPGPRGPAGEDGESIVGPAGPKGDAGADSTVPGPIGETGPQGLPGLGIPGLPGEPGVAGPQGPSGESIVGPQGERGEKGDATSSTGARGPAGKDGVTKTVVVEAGGSVTEVGSLPATGSDDTALWLGAIGGALLVSGGVAMFATRKRRSV